MKLLVLILLLLNAVLFAYFNVNKPQQTASTINPPIQPEKLRLLTPAELETMPRKQPEQAQGLQPVEFSCYEWGSFSATSLERARETLTRLSLDATLMEKSPQEATRYWVYLPQSRTLQQAQARVQQLRRQGVEESFVVFEPQWRYAISLGVFKDEQLAAKLLEEIKKKGVTSAVKGVRNQEQGQTSLLISNMSLDKVVEISKLKPDFPGSELKQVTCQ
ncbi:MAG TPA: SPOR domain-containing protein [Methylophilaceae bacterium]|nr:SPOR domain-containing protein [Methylophilaceae bacterium]